MDREQLAARHTDVIRRHSRALADTGGQPGTPLLDELAEVAEEYAASLNWAATAADVPVHQAPGSGFSAAMHPGVAVEDQAEPVKLIEVPPKTTTRKPAARRTTTRRSPK